MKNLAKTLLAVVAALGMGAAYAATLQSAVIPFTSTNDTYADGTSVIDGEWYALCWSQNDTFGGIKPNLTPLKEGDRVYCKGPLAENGGCDVTFVVSTPPAGGNYFVVMLDTRVGPKTLADVVNGVPATVNGTGLARSVAIAELGGNWAKPVDGAVDNDTAANYNPVIGENFKPARITGFSIVGNQAVITVSDMSLGAKYIVKSGSSIKDIKTTGTIGLTDPTAGSFENDGECDFKFVIDSDDAKFFQVFQAK